MPENHESDQNGIAATRKHNIEGDETHKKKKDHAGKVVSETSSGEKETKRSKPRAHHIDHNLNSHHSKEELKIKRSAMIDEATDSM